MELKFHHIGIVVNSIEDYEKKMLYSKKVNEVDDLIQNSRLALYENYGETFIELIQPLGEKSTSFNSLQKFGNHLNHLCYQIESLEKLKSFLDYGWIKVFGPVPAKLFDNKKVVFYLNRSGQLTEFILSN